jgi:hypothetical protein
VVIEIAGLEARWVRIATLLPVIRHATVRAALTRNGEVKEIKEEQRIKPNYSVPNGIRVAENILKAYITSQMVIADTRVFISYEGQPITCYTCNATGHKSLDCRTGGRKHDRQ